VTNAGELQLNNKSGQVAGWDESTPQNRTKCCRMKLKRNRWVWKSEKKTVSTVLHAQATVSLKFSWTPLKQPDFINDN